jgi:hypothetical protein
MQIPTGRYLLPDGSLLLEGTGVQPTLRIPITLETATSTDDVVLAYAERAILEPLGAGITPSSSPTLLDNAATMDALSSADIFEDIARESYSDDEYLQMDTSFPFTITLSRSKTLLWVYGWCAADQPTLDDNINKLDLTFTLNDEDIPLDSFVEIPYDAQGQTCIAYVLGLTDWVGGEHHAVTTITYTTLINDGVYDFGPGYQSFEYNIYVKP